MLEKAELKKLIKKERILMKEEEARNRYNHTYCLALKKKLNKVTAEFKSVNDRYANVTRKIE